MSVSAILDINWDSMRASLIFVTRFAVQMMAVLAVETANALLRIHVNVPRDSQINWMAISLALRVRAQPKFIQPEQIGEFDRILFKSRSVQIQ